MAIRQADVVSHYEMCQAERRNLQQGMNFRPGGRRSVILMSLRKGAPYADRIEEAGRVLIYEGHDEPRAIGAPDPKTVDQPEYNRGRLNQNGQFAARESRAQFSEEPLPAAEPLAPRILCGSSQAHPSGGRHHGGMSTALLPPVKDADDRDLAGPARPARSTTAAAAAARGGADRVAASPRRSPPQRWSAAPSAPEGWP